MKFGFVNESQFNRFGNKQIGEAAVSHGLDLLIATSEGTKKLVGGEILDLSRRGHLQFGDVLVQFGRTDAPGPSFRITFPKAFGSDDVFGFIQEAGNDAPGTYNRAQLDGSNLPNATGMDVIVETGGTSEFYFWLAIGKLAQ